jgi:hypothetical protein
MNKHNDYYVFQSVNPKIAELRLSIGISASLPCIFVAVLCG